MTPRDTIADAILTTKPLAARYFAGFDDTNHTAQAPGLPNHLAWSLGHLALTMSRICEKIDGRPLPEASFSADPVGAAATRYCTEDIAFASRPLADATRYPALARCIEIYNDACDRLAAAVRDAAETKLGET